MKIVTYARVSTIGQETTGQSLQNQERAFADFVKRTGAKHIAAYKEARSAKTKAGRVEFLRMLDDLPRLRPDAIVIDTLDRFTRNLTEGLLELENLRKLGVGLIEIDAETDAVLNIGDNKSRDWEYVANRFMSAQLENNRRSRRIKASYDGRRARNVSTANTASYGVRRNALGEWEPDGERADLVREVERRFVAGESLSQVWNFAHAIDPQAWGTMSGLRRSLEGGDQYRRAGLRSTQTHDEIAARLEIYRKRFGLRRDHPHEYTGVFACGVCVDMGLGERLMSGHFQHQHGVDLDLIVCRRYGLGRGVGGRHPATICVVSEKIAEPWSAYLEVLASEQWMQAWAAIEETQAAANNRMMAHRIHEFDERLAALDKRKMALIDLYVAGADLAVSRETLRAIDIEIAMTREQQHAAQAEIEKAGTKRRKPRSVAELRAQLRDLAGLYERVTDARERNRLNRELCAFVGSHPVLRRPQVVRDKRACPIVISWPEVDAATERVRTEV